MHGLIPAYRPGPLPPQLAALAWPIERLAEAMESLARHCGLSTAHVAMPPALLPEANVRLDLARHVGAIGRAIGIEAEPVETGHGDLANCLLHAGPAVVRLSDSGRTVVMLLAGRKASTLAILGPDLKQHRLPVEGLRDHLAAPLEAPHAEAIARLVAASGVAPDRHAALTAILQKERHAGEAIGGIWLLRQPATGPARAMLRQARVGPAIAGIVALMAAVYTLDLVGWTLIGDAALNGRVDFGWLSAWLIVVVTLVPARFCAGWLQARLAIAVGRLVKLRLLWGAMRIDIQALRAKGAGGLLSGALEAQAFELAAFNGAAGAILGGLELAVAAWVLTVGAGGGLSLAVLAGWLAITIATGLVFHRRTAGWTGERLAMTQSLVEKMAGHRTRLAQEQERRRDAEEDRQASRYLAASAGMDRAAIPFAVFVPAGWMVVGIAALMPAFISGQANRTGLAIGLGGVFLAGRAFGSISGGIAAISRAVLAWAAIGTLFRAAASAPLPEGSLPAGPLVTPRATDGRAVLLEGVGLTLTHQGRSIRVIDGAAITILQGDRILLEGRSGSGKSTLASLISGLREPDHGFLLLNGLDRHTLGDRWRDHVVEAPQFHENHILTGPLAFNLLMGRQWPPTPDDLAEARDLCEDLGLGPLIARMPGGLMQTVGETGWQLSHGEQSRIFLARALLQKADLTILDESFAALDPKTQVACLRCAFRHAKALLVIAHP